MPNEHVHGIRAGLAHEEARIDHIALNPDSIRPEFRSCHFEVVVGLRQQFDRVNDLLHKVDGAKGDEILHLTNRACRAWRDLRTRILRVTPERRRTQMGEGSTARSERTDPGPAPGFFARGA